MVLIISESYDQSTNDVLDWIFYNGIKVIRINSDDNISCKSLRINNIESNINLFINGKIKFEISPFSKITTWYRRGIFKLKFENNSINYFARNRNFEKKFLEDYIKMELSKSKYLNKEEDNFINKLEVLGIAVEIGLKIPDTLITNQNIELSMFLKKHKRVITKSISELGSNFHLRQYSCHFSCGSVLLTDSDIEEDSNFELSLFWKIH